VSDIVDLIYALFSFLPGNRPFLPVKVEYSLVSDGIPLNYYYFLTGQNRASGRQRAAVTTPAVQHGGVHGGVHTRNQQFFSLTQTPRKRDS